MQDNSWTTVGRLLRVAASFNKSLDGEEAPYPGMEEAFEAHFGQSWTDPEWRKEAATWAAAWKKSRTAALMDACESIQTACINGELPDVCEDAIRAIKID